MSVGSWVDGWEGLCPGRPWPPPACQCSLYFSFTNSTIVCYVFQKFNESELMDEKDSLGSEAMAPSGLPVFQGQLMQFLDARAPVLGMATFLLTCFWYFLCIVTLVSSPPPLPAPMKSLKDFRNPFLWYLHELIRLWQPSIYFYGLMGHILCKIPILDQTSLFARYLKKI